MPNRILDRRKLTTLPRLIAVLPLLLSLIVGIPVAKGQASDSGAVFGGDSPTAVADGTNADASSAVTLYSANATASDASSADTSDTATASDAPATAVDSSAAPGGAGDEGNAGGGGGDGSVGGGGSGGAGGSGGGGANGGDGAVAVVFGGDSGGADAVASGSSNQVVNVSTGDAAVGVSLNSGGGTNCSGLCPGPSCGTSCGGPPPCDCTGEETGGNSGGGGTGDGAGSGSGNGGEGSGGYGSNAGLGEVAQGALVFGGDGAINPPQVAAAGGPPTPANLPVPPPTRAVPTPTSTPTPTPAPSPAPTPHPTTTLASVDLIGGKAIAQQGPTTISAGQRTTVEGWAIDAPAGTGAGGVFVTIDDQLHVWAPVSLARPDVASVLGKPGYKDSGYSANIPPRALKPGRHTLTLLVVSHDFRFIYETPPIKIELLVVPSASSSSASQAEATATSTAVTPAPVVQIPTATPSPSPSPTPSPTPIPTTQATIDVAVIAGKMVPRPPTGPLVVPANSEIQLAGWAVDSPAHALASAVFVIVDGQHEFKAQYGVERPDVAKALNNPAFLKSGYAATIPANTLTPGLHTITLKVIGHDGTTAYAVPSQTFQIEATAGQ